ncbi:MAG: alpha/beta hydrolase [Burkholderiales bacterium]|nr:alpha/beta hydrolase [Burkholderiales bacterium]
MPFIDIHGHTIEYARFAGAGNRATVVLLHEGLGSVAMWRDFPARLAAASAHSVVAYSRLGYGKSDRLADGSDPAGPRRNLRAPDFMHREAFETLPALLAALGIDHPVLFGHSDGGSIALLYASRHPAHGVIAMAPHVRVEDVSIASIEKARADWESTDLSARLGKYHDDAEGAFRGWNDVWLAPAFRDWNIEAELASIKAPILAIQGENDPYGTLYQIEEIARRNPRTRLFKIPGCGHAPHREHPDIVLSAVQSFLATLPETRRAGAAP